ncbi:autophagy-related protein 22-like protein [Lipomyces kononenkoae]|uniref:Autophagy-related protein 22-like protein n=1 Tax=Lipomyces kononenkoae TaxID=34357 RepID=A0ACC3T201_LIPKO
MPEPYSRVRDASEYDEAGVDVDTDSSSATVADLGLQRVSTSFSTYSQLDRRPTSRKEILGWLSFATGAEPFAVAAVGIYLPILLEQLARDKSVMADDHSVSCEYFEEVPGSSPGLSPGTGTERYCVTPALGFYVHPASFALYTFSISVFLQAIVVISMSGAADRGNYRKSLLLAFSCLGGLSSILLVAAVPSTYYLASILTIIGNVSFGAVAVCGNAFLPVLVRNHPDVLAAESGHQLDSREDSFSNMTESSALTVTESGPDEIHGRKPPGVTDIPQTFESFPPNTVDPDARSFFDYTANDAVAEKAAEISNHLSGLGVACGYLSAFVVQTSGIIFVAAMGSTMLSIRLVLVGIGVWWLVFCIPTALFMRPRPGPRLHIREKDKVVVRYVTYAWKTLWRTAKEVRKLRDVVLYLIGWFIISDSATTLNATAVLFARTELHMTPAALAVVGIITMIFGIAGAIIFSRYVQKYLNIPPNKVIMLIVAMTTLVPTYGLFGFVTDKIGLHHPWEIYILAAVYGLSLGGMSSVCRSVFSMLIPPGKESTFFSLYAVTDKGSSIIGPTIAAMITDRTRNIRYTFYFLFILLMLSMPIFYFLDAERGMRDAQRFGEEEEESIVPRRSTARPDPSPRGEEEDEVINA